MFAFNFSPPTSRMGDCNVEGKNKGKKERKKRKATKKRECIKGNSKNFSCSQDQLQSSPKLLESGTLKCEVCQQQRGPLPWVPSTILLQACLSARLADQSRRRPS